MRLQLRLQYLSEVFNMQLLSFVIVIRFMITLCGGIAKSN